MHGLQHQGGAYMDIYDARMHLSDPSRCATIVCIGSASLSFKSEPVVTAQYMLQHDLQLLASEHLCHIPVKPQ